MNWKLNRAKKITAIAAALFVTMVLVVMVPATTLALDHDGDGQSDISVYRPSDPVLGDGVWFVLSSALNSTLRYQWGFAGDVPVQGNYSQAAGMGIGTDLAVFRPSDGTWYIRAFSANLSFPNLFGAFQWGLPGDTPVPCDFDGDGRDELALYRAADGNWYTRNSQGATAYDNFTIQQWGGLSGDVPFPADFDNDGECDFTIYRDGNWFVIPSSESNASATIPWGAAGDIPVPGQYDADNITDFAVFRPSSALWIIRRSTLAGLTFRVIQWGLPTDTPVSSDFTGDGKTDIAVFRPSLGLWFVLTSESNYTTAQAVQQFGTATDIPLGDVAAN